MKLDYDEITLNTKNMTTLELEFKKNSIIRRILDINNEDIVNKVSDFIEKVSSTPPCSYSEEEIVQGIDQFMADLKQYELGEQGKFFTEEEVIRKFSQKQ